MTAIEALDVETEILRRLLHGPLHTWQLTYNDPGFTIEMSLYRLRKRGLITYDKRKQIWSTR